MTYKQPLTVAISIAFVTMAGLAAATQGPSSSAGSYLLPTDPAHTSFTSILTTGDAVGGYRMAGIPDGLGAYDNGDGTFTVLMNHELGGTLGVTRAHGGVGAFVSQFVIDKGTLKVLSGADLMRNVYDWNTAAQSLNTDPSTLSFNRFCSADLSPVTAYFNPVTGLGTQARIFMHGEEGGARGAQLATVATGADKGNAYVLGRFNLSTNGSGQTGVGAWENALANPIAQDRTIVIGNSDGGTGIMNNALAVYVGTKTNAGTEVDKAGLTNGSLKFVSVDGNAAEIVNPTTRATNIANGTRFSLSSSASTQFSRPEDGAWSLDGKHYYFNTTDRLDTTDLTGGTQIGATRLWQLAFDDIANPDAGGRIDLLIDSSKIAGGLGNARPNMWDNLSVNRDGTITLLEDTGNANHNGKVWSFNPTTGDLHTIAKFDPQLFGDVDPVSGAFLKPNPAAFHTSDEETSGVIDITDVLGRNDGRRYLLLDAQDHASAANLGLPNPAELVEGGQLLLAATTVPEPGTYVLMLAGFGAAVLLRRRRAV